MNFQAKAWTVIDSADFKASQALSKMTLKEKVFELHGKGIIRFGVSFIFGKKVKPVTFGGNKKLGIPEGVFLDGPRGISLYKGATAFPATIARAATWNPELEKRVGIAMGEEVRALGGNYSGAVCMNLLRHPAGGRAQEGYGEDPYLTGEMAVGLSSGIQSQNVMACAKHIALNSMENNRFGGNFKIDERSLQEVYLPHFRRVVQSGIASLMSAYNKVNGEYCGENKMLLKDILHDSWGFQGFVSSDWQFGLFHAQKGIEAGMHVEMPKGKCYNIQAIKKLISTHAISEAQIDSLVLPVIRTKIAFASKQDLGSYSKSLLACNEHIQLARKVAEESAVLLKNENNILPLSQSIKKIAVIGSLADIRQTGDHGSSNVLAPYVISLKDALLADPTLQILSAKERDTEKIKNICKEADVVIVMAGNTYEDEGEHISNGKIKDIKNPDKKNGIVNLGMFGLGGDRKYLHLHQNDIDIIHLAAANNQTVIVCMSSGGGNTVEEWQSEVPVILQQFYNGMEGGNALKSILFGDINPSGKMPVTIPVNESDLPPFHSFDKEVEYGYYHGYTFFDKYQKAVRYPFGYGLSYTQFELHDLKIDNPVLAETDTLQLAVTLKNTGTRSGAEVVQIYIGFPGTDIDRPVKLLRAFRKTELNAGQESLLQFRIPASDLKYYDVISHTWKMESGSYHIYAGNSSEDKNFLKDDFRIR